MLTAVFICALGINIVLVDELEPTFPDRLPKSSVEAVDVPRGGITGVHLWIEGLSAENPIHLDVRGGGTLPKPSWYRLIDVPVEENTGPKSRTERWDKAENPHVVRDAPFRIYEILKPVQQVIDIKSEQVLIRVQWAIPLEAIAGAYDLDLVVSQGDTETVAPLTLHIHSAAIPPPGSDTLGYTNWFSPGNIAQYHDLAVWSEPFWRMLEQYAAMMAYGRQNMFWVRWPDFFTRVEGQWKLQPERLVRYVDLFSDAGLYWIEGAPFAGRPDGDWSSEVLELKLGGEQLTSDRGITMFAHQASQIHDLMVEQDWAGRWVQHIADEPTDVNAKDYCRAAELLRTHLPGVPLFEATMSRQLTDCVDMWCPQVQAWQGNRSFFDERREAGDRVWVYTCLRPGGPWLNRLLDQERIRQVYFGWGAAKEGWDGYLHWGLNHWKADPFAQSVVDHPAMPDTDNRLPAGDTHVLYPGPAGPWSGLRFEAHRIGMEDHALLMQVPSEDRISVIDPLYRAADDWSDDVALYRSARRSMLEMLSRSVPRIEILGFPGCPMTPDITRSVRLAAPLAEIVETDLSTLPVEDRRLCWPAPTVLVNGKDLFGTQPKDRPALACRVYPGGPPAEAAVVEAMAQTLNSSP